MNTDRRDHREKADRREVAQVSYFWGPGLQELLATIGRAWELNLNDARKQWANGQKHIAEENVAKARGVFDFGRAFSLMVFGSVFTAVIVSLHVIILAVLWLGRFILFLIVRIPDAIYRWMRGFFFICPNCHQRTSLPVYVCSKCSNRHPRLLPSPAYGVFRHQCSCGEWLPAAFFLGRDALSFECPAPECNERRDASYLESQKRVIAIAGAQSAGKTAFLFGATVELLNKKSRVMQGEPKLHDKRSQALYKDYEHTLAQDGMLPKTSDKEAQAFLVHFEDGKNTEIVYLHDPAGEVFGTSKYFGGQGYLGAMRGVALMIDPFALTELNRAGELLTIEDVVNYLTMGIEAQQGIGRSDVIQTPIAVIISKVDKLRLDDFGPRAVIEKQRQMGARSSAEARNELIREKLIAWGGRNAVNLIETRFKTVAYFPVAALKSEGTGQRQGRYEHWGVMAALDWLLEQR